MRIRYPWAWRVGMVALIAAVLSRVFGAGSKVMAAGSAVGLVLILVSRVKNDDQPPPRV